MYLARVPQNIGHRLAGSFPVTKGVDQLCDVRDVKKRCLGKSWESGIGTSGMPTRMSGVHTVEFDMSWRRAVIFLVIVWRCGVIDLIATCQFAEALPRWFT